MPTFVSIILSAPIGFNDGCLALNSESLNDGNSITLRTQQILATTKAKELKNHLIEKIDTNETKVLKYIVRSISAAVPSVTKKEIASVLDTVTFLSRDCIAQIIAGLEEDGNPEVLESLKKFTNQSGKLENFKWRIGVALSSSSCKRFFSPYVSISFDIIDCNSKISSHTAELNLEQFKAFQSSFEKVAKVMDEL
eukprot:gene7817-10619_t